SRQGRAGRVGKLCRAVSPAALAGAPRTKRRDARCDDARVDGDLGDGHRSRPRLDRARRLAQWCGLDGRMTAEQLFSTLNLITVASWLLLVCLPRVRWTATVVPVVMPCLLSIVYVLLIAATLTRS